MKISELIQCLEKFIKEEGDYECVYCDSLDGIQTISNIKVIMKDTILLETNKFED